MKHLIAICSIAALAACATPEERIADYTDQCRAMGYAEEALPDCVANLYSLRAQQLENARTQTYATGMQLLTQPTYRRPVTTNCWRGLAGTIQCTTF